MRGERSEVTHQASTTCVWLKRELCRWNLHLRHLVLCQSFWYMSAKSAYALCLDLPRNFLGSALFDSISFLTKTTQRSCPRERYFNETRFMIYAIMELRHKTGVASRFRRPHVLRPSYAGYTVTVTYTKSPYKTFCDLQASVLTHWHTSRIADR